MNGNELGPWPLQVMEKLPMNVEVIIGLDVVLKFGLSVKRMNNDVEIKIWDVEDNEGVLASECQSALVARCAAGKADNEEPVPGVGNLGKSSGMENQFSIEVTDDDFRARFVGGRWTVEWKWVDDESPAFCSKPNYQIPEKDKPAFVAEIEDWIATGILVEWNEREHGGVKNFNCR